MRSTCRTLPLFAVVASLALGSTACKRAAERLEEKAIERQTGGEVHLDSKAGTVTFAGDGGSWSAGAGSKIPDDFPKAVPVYPGAKAELAARSNNPQGKSAWTLTLDTSDPRDKVLAFYKANLTGFKNASDLNMGDTDMSVWQSPQYEVTLMVNAAADQKTTITISATAK